jgi:hypothetical protein
VVERKTNTTSLAFTGPPKYSLSSRDSSFSAPGIALASVTSRGLLMMTPIGAVAALVTRTTESRKNGSRMSFFATRKIDFEPGVSSATAGRREVAAARSRIAIRTPPS